MDIALIILAILTLIIIILLSLNIYAIIEYDQNLNLKIKYTFFTLTLYPKKTKKKKKKEKKPKNNSEKADNDDNNNVSGEKNENEGNKKTKKNGIFRNLDLSNYIDILKIINDNLIKKIFIKMLFLNIQVGSENAAQTAMIYGQINAAVFPVIGSLYNSGRLFDVDVHIKPAFLTNNVNFKAKTILKIKTFYGFFAILKILRYITKNN